VVAARHQCAAGRQTSAPVSIRAGPVRTGGGTDDEEDGMRRITVLEHVSLDGVMQAPGGPDEDTRDGFDRGGRGRAYGDEVLAVPVR
jgi:hypothetical protein